MKKISMKNLDSNVLGDVVAEAQVIKKLVHPNILYMKDAFEVGDDFVIIKEFAKNGNLNSEIRRR